jgi:hypothetical protein
MRRGLVVCLLAGCGDASVGVGSSSSTGGLASISASEPGTSEAVEPTGGPLRDVAGDPCGLGNGDLGLSYIWIANSMQGTISKIDSRVVANSGVYCGFRRVA